MEHTKGKWEIRPKLANGDRHFNIVVNKPANCICQTNVPGMRGLHPISPKEIKANARLIAAAPELLKACLKAAPFVSMCIDANSNAGTVYHEIEQAIAKAQS